MPCAMPPQTWPSTIIGLIMLPQSWMQTYFRIFTVHNSGSTSTIAAWTP